MSFLSDGDREKLSSIGNFDITKITEKQKNIIMEIAFRHINDVLLPAVAATGGDKEKIKRATWRNKLTLDEIDFELGLNAPIINPVTKCYRDYCMCIRDGKSNCSEKLAECLSNIPTI